MPLAAIMTLVSLRFKLKAVVTTELPFTVYVCRQESEGEEAADSRVTLADDLGRGNLASRQSRVKLQEVNSLQHASASGCISNITSSLRSCGSIC